MKKIKVLFFGSLSEAAGKQEELIDTEGDVDEVLLFLKEKYPSISELRFSVAINQEINLSEKKLNDGDEVALLPPFTGG